MIHLLHLWRRTASSVHDVCWKRRAHCHPLPSTVWALQQNPKLFEAARYNQINSCLAPRYDQFTSCWLVVFVYNPMNNINISWPTNHLLILRNIKKKGLKPPTRLWPKKWDWAMVSTIMGALSQPPGWNFSFAMHVRLRCMSLTKRGP